MPFELDRLRLLVQVDGCLAAAVAVAAAVASCHCHSRCPYGNPDAS